jgi:hypothetical protein
MARIFAMNLDASHQLWGQPFFLTTQYWKIIIYVFALQYLRRESINIDNCADGPSTEKLTRSE